MIKKTNMSIQKHDELQLNTPYYQVGKQFKIEFEFLLYYKFKMLNVLQMTMSNGDSRVNGSCKKFLSFDYDGSLHVNYDLFQTDQYEAYLFPLKNYTWYSVKISQEKERNYYLFTITINGQAFIAKR